MYTVFGVAWENILVGILSGVLVTLMQRLVKRYNDWKIEKKYPIAGNYITKFEDEENGVKIIKAASATFTQKGKTIGGETQEGSRFWLFDGKITDSGYLHGIYYSKDPHDKGIGNFFLHIDYQRNMEGLWSGYDSINKKIVSGRYSFTPMVNNIIIHDTTENDIPAIANLVDKELGKDYLPEELLSDFAASKDRYVFEVAKIENEIVGFCISIIADRDEVKGYIRAKKLPNALEYSKKIGIMKTVVVKNSLKGKGVGTSLVQHTLDKLKHLHDVRSFCSIGWKSKEKINIDGVLKRFDFTFYKEIPEYWASDSIEKEYNCVDCGSPPCKCSAVIYTMCL